MAATILVLGGCSGGSDDEASTVSADNNAGAGSATELEAGGDQAARDAGDAEQPSLAVDAVALARAREVVRTGDVDMVVDDVGDATAGVGRLARAVDGFVADERTRADSAGADLTVRVPAEAFDDVREEIAGLGDVVEQSVEARDVTAEVVDVETRLASLRASVERLQGLLGRAGDVGQLAAVEGELARRETELEALMGQQRVLADQVALATLAVHLSERDRPSPDDDAAGFTDGLRRGWVVAVDGGRFVLAAAGFLVPLAVPAAAVALAAVAVRRRVTRSGVRG